MISVGIDVGAKQLDVVINNSGRLGQVKRFDNDAAGHRALAKLLQQRQVQRVCLEATGVYHLDLAVTLHTSGLFELMVLNPRAAHNFAKALLTRGKTDESDAAVLSQFAQQMPFQAWHCPSQALLALRACARRIATLVKQQTQAKNHLHALQASEQTPDFLIEDAQFSIEQLRQQIARLRAKARELIAADTSAQQAYELLCSVKGVAEVSAITLLGELLLLPEDMNAKQWVAMAGLDPRQHQSGSSVHKKPRVSKAGNRYLRSGLYMPALSAARHDDRVRAYYTHLIENRGLKPLQAICAVMRKLLHAIHGMFRTGERFDNTRFYSISPESS